MATEAAERLEILSLVVAFAPGAQGLRFLGRADSLPPVGVLFVAQRCPDEEVAAAAEAVELRAPLPSRIDHLGSTKRWEP